VDEILCRLQESVEETAPVRFGKVPLRMGMGRLSGLQFGRVGDEQNEGLGLTVAKVIEFYVPNIFRPRSITFSGEHRGKVIEFPPREHPIAPDSHSLESTSPSAHDSGYPHLGQR